MWLQARKAPTMDGYGKLGFFYTTKVAYRVFLPINYRFFPYTRVVHVGYRIDPYQTLSNKY